MIHCNVCCQWRPTQWEGWRWADTAAKCMYKDKFVCANESCEYGSIVPKAIRVPTLACYTGPGTSVVSFAEYVSPLTTPLSQKRQVSETYELQKPEFFELYQHQKDAVERYADKTEIALFWEMGVAKSATVLRIAGHKFREKQIDRLLIIAPNRVHVQWSKEQIPFWLDVAYEQQCLFGDGGRKVAYKFDDDPSLLQVVIVNVETFSTPQKWRDIAEWANHGKTMIILDEATAIKTPSSQRAQRILYEFNDVVRKGKQIKSSVPKSVARAVLTGTPATNGPNDLWAIMEFVRPNYFGRNWYAFQARYCMQTSLTISSAGGQDVRTIKVPLTAETWDTIKQCLSFEEANQATGCSMDTFDTVHGQDHFEGPYKHADELAELLKPVADFKLLKDVTDMPVQTYIVRELNMPENIRDVYTSMEDEMLAEWDGKTMTASNVMVCMLRLQQISSGFIVDKQEIDDDEDPDDVDAVSRMFGLIDEVDVTNEPSWIGKSNPKLDRLYEDIDETAKPCIVITRFSAEAARIYTDLSKRYRVCLLTGWKKVGTVQEFQEGKYDIMVANSVVVSRGFNLQNACTVFFYSNSFSLEMRLQAEGRIFRIGQKNPCVYVDYLYIDSVDEQVVSALKMKRSLLDYIRTASIRDIIHRV